MRPGILIVLLATLCACAGPQPSTVSRTDGIVTIIIVRHAETNQALKHLPLSSVGEQRAKLLTQTLRGVRPTHLFASHTVRAKQMLDETAAARGLTVTQLPAPGSTIAGEVVTDLTDRQVAVQPIGEALRKLPSGSVAIVALNSENIFGVMNRLGVPVVSGCAPGAMCVPCTNNTCFPRESFDQLWHVVLQPGADRPLGVTELRYGQGWAPVK